MSAAKVINLTASLVSIFVLETAMLTRFGEGDESFRRVMTSGTGTGVYAIVLGMEVYMIRWSAKALKYSKAWKEYQSSKPIQMICN